MHGLIRGGRLPAERMGRDHFIEEADLKLVENRKTGRPPKANPEQSNSKKKGKRRQNHAN
ncbi:MAG: hypothetical protein M3R15_35320 [Acidobacteriota bacterium]|nr:hypothetical protein [Acidobacteriota bacterium]